MDERNDYNSIPMQPIQTAVDWLVKQLNQKIDFIPMDKWDEIRDIVQQAKQMEKEQIIQAHENGQAEFDSLHYRDKNVRLSNNYYNQTYNQNK